MTRQVVLYASELNLPKNIIEWIDGSGQFCFANPWFDVPGIGKIDKKTYLDMKPDSQYGIYLNSPYLYVRDINGVFASSYNFPIGYANISKQGSQITKIPKDYWICRPYDTSNYCRNMKCKIDVSPMKSGDTYDKADINMVTMDYQVSVVMAVLLLAKINELNLTTYKGLNNLQFLTKLCTEINGVMKERIPKPVEIDTSTIDILANSFTDPPFYTKNSKNELIPVYDLDGSEPSFTDIYTLFREAVIKGKGLGKYGAWEKVLKKPVGGIIPTIRYSPYESKRDGDGVYKMNLKCRFVFNVLVDRTDPEYKAENAKRSAKMQISATELKALHKNDMPALWGAIAAQENEAQPTARGMAHKGCIFLNYNPIFRYSEKAGPTMEWIVSRLAFSKREKVTHEEFMDGADFIDPEDLEQQTPVQATITQEPTNNIVKPDLDANIY